MSFFSSSILFGFSIFTFQIKEMDLEARSLQPNVKAVLLAKLREYKSDLDNLKSERLREYESDLDNLKSETKQMSSPNSNSNQVARDELLEARMADTLTVCVAVFYE